MARYINVDELNRAKFHPLPYTHIIPADIKDAEAYERGWNDAIDAIIETTDVVEVVTCKDCVFLEVLNSENYYARCSWHGRLFPSFGNPDTRYYFCADCQRRKND